MITFILCCNVNVLLTTCQSGSLLLVLLVARVLPEIELVFLMSVFQPLWCFQPGFGTNGVVGCRAGLPVVVIPPCFRAASYDPAFLNIQESSISGTRVVSM